MSDVDFSQKPMDVPTLDWLNSLDSDKYPETEKTDTSITKYSYYKKTNTYTPSYYEVIEQPDYIYENMYFYGTSSSYHEKTPDGTNYAHDFSHISNSANLGNIVGDKLSINNYSGSIENIIGDFIGDSYGILNGGEIQNINANFYNKSGDWDNRPGVAIDSSAYIGNISGYFVENSVYLDAGAIRNGHHASWNDTSNHTAHIDNINAVFISNSSKQSGGAIANSGTIDKIDSAFIGNNAGIAGGAIVNYYDGSTGWDHEVSIGEIKGSFQANTAAYGGAIYNGVEIGTIEAEFQNNVAKEAGGGAIYNDSYDAYGVITNIKDSKFIGNSTIGAGGAIQNTGYIGVDENTGIINSTFKNNSSSLGGAIYTYNDLQIIADNGVSEFTGNFTKVDGVRDDNAIFVNVSCDQDMSDYPPVVLTLKAKNNGQILMNDNIDGGHYKLVLTGDNTGKININNEIRNAYISQEDSVTNVSKGEYLNHNNSLDVTGGVMNIQDMGLASVRFNDLSLSGAGVVNINSVDVDLENKEMGRITADTYSNVSPDAKINVNGINLISDAKAGEDVVAVYFADSAIKDNMVQNVKDLPQEGVQKVAYSPIYKYSVTYDKDHEYDGKGDGGYFMFTRGDRNGGSSGADAFNPAVLATPVSSVAAAQATINETFKYVFEHADAFTQLPNVERMARINANKYAISTDFNHNLGSLCPAHNNKAAWFRPYATFETMNLKNGPKVNATTYGSLAGFDTDFHEHKNGWHSVGTGYIGYNGSQLSYKGVDTTMNGGILGYTHTMYKGNFWTALTLSAGASVGESRTMYGKEDFTSLMAGVGSKTGYNFEFKEGKYILQPIMFMSYTFVNTFDYTNAAGVRINADPAHSIQLNPSVRFISNFKNGWQPYASVGMVWNVMNENNVTANSVRLPEMSMKPYVEYGVGVQRNWKDKFTAFGQAMLRNGGRNGIALTAGFRWALGKEGKPVQKVENSSGVNLSKVEVSSSTRTVLKQLTPQQKLALTGKKNTTITSAKAVVKAL